MDPKIQKADEDDLNLPDLEFDDRDDLNEGDESQKKVEPVSDPRIDALMAQVGELKGRLSVAEERNVALMATPITKLAPTPPGPVSFEGLPDPALDGEGYGRELMARFEARNQAVNDYNTQLQSQDVDRNDRYQGLWDDFSINHEDYAEDPDRVEFAASKVLARAKSRGLNIESYVFGHSEKFQSDVVAEMDKIYGKPKAGEETDPGFDPVKKEANRTAGMFGGQESGNKPGKGEDERSGMFTDIKKFQMEHGFY